MHRYRVSMRTCGRCGTNLGPEAHPNRRYCSDICRTAAGNEAIKGRELREQDHGKRVGYAKGCRCDLCRAQNAAYSRSVRSRTPKGPRKERSDKGTRKNRPVKHGTPSGYKSPCRCRPCTAAAARYNAAWRKANEEYARAWFREYRLSNPDKIRGYSAARQAHPIIGEALAYVAVITADPCSYCGGPSAEIDHIEALAIGGDSAWTNLTPACRSCNARKSKMPMLEFLVRR